MFIEVVTYPGADDMATVERGMREFERSKLPDVPTESEKIPVGAFARATGDNSIVGGIKASIFWNGLEVETLWVADEQRGQGAGSKLLTGIEEFAKSNGAVVAFLTTVEGRDFYERHGY
ncbi:MAG: GNAT family N-acetyltransferase, partial [Woeseiaceae bacterium]